MLKYRRLENTTMKPEIHPTYYPAAKVICSCGHTFTTGSTLPEIKVEICSECHPFYTGQQKLIDTEGRVERFQKKQELAKKSARERATRKAKKNIEKDTPKTLREMVEKEKAKLHQRGTSDLAKLAALAAKKAASLPPDK